MVLGQELERQGLFVQFRVQDGKRRYEVCEIVWVVTDLEYP